MLLILVYGVVWLFFGMGERLYQEAFNAGAEAYYELEGKNLLFRIEGDESVFRYYARPAFEARLSPKSIVSNLPFLLTLLIITPGMRLSRRAIKLALGMLLLYLSHLAFLIVKVEVTLLAAKHPAAGSQAFWQAADDFFEVTGKAFFPIAIWMALTLPYMLGRIDRASAASPAKTTTGRNQPCPCGSGRKFKHCCGKS